MKELRIKDICEKGSSNLKQKDVEGQKGHYPVYGASGIISHIDSYQQEEKYIAIVKDGSGIGRVSFMPAKSSVIGTLQYILPKKGYNINYIGYCLQSLDLSKYHQGAAIPHIYFRDYGERIVKVTENISEQQSIVNYLDSAFAKIDAVKANAEKALNDAKALFQAALNEMLKPKEGWEEKKLKTLTSKIGSGATPKGGRNVYIDNGCHLIRSMNVQYNEFKYDELAHITDSAASQLKGVEVKENDVLFNITGASIARCCVVPADVLPARVNQHVSILRIKQDVLPYFLSYILNSPQHQKVLLKIGESGSTRQALTKNDLENHVISFPDIDSQVRILSVIDTLKSKVDQLQANCDKITKECEALKQAILRQTFE